MAAAPETTDEFKELLTCSICLEVFRKPKYLPCLHTFCEVCINTYISSSLHEKNKGINCPVCRKFVPLEGASKQLESWGDELPTNFLIASMISLREIKTSEKLCNGCQSENTMEIAISWCTVCAEAYCGDCMKQHKKFRMSINHKIISLDEFQSEKYSVDNNEFVACDEHKDKTIEVYCVDHCKPCCTVCATVNHRKCENVISIDRAVSGIKTATKTVQLKEELQQFSQQIEKSVKKKRDNVSDVERETTSIHMQTDKLAEDMINHIRKIKDDFNSNLKAKKKEVLMELDEEKEEMLSLKSTVATWKSILDTCLKHGSEVQCLIEVNRLLSMKTDLGQRIGKSIAKMETKLITFKPSEKVTDSPNHLESLGKVTTVGCRTDLPYVDIRTGSVKVLFTVGVFDHKSGSNYASGLFFRDIIILTNYQNSKIQTYNNEGEVLSYLQLPNQPYDVTKVTDNSVAVSCYNTKQIHVINVKDMNLQNTITVDAPVFGLVYVDNQYIVGYNSTLTWVDATTGRKNKEIKTNAHSYYLYACGTKDYIYGDGSNTVSCSSNGKTKFTYTNKDLSVPRGIDTDFQGNIYICGYSSHNIHQITREGKLVRIIPSSTVGVQYPWVIRFKPNSNIFLLTSNISGKVVICEIS